MDEPHDVTAGLDDSLASEVAERVKKIVEGAERDALAVRREVDDEIRRLLEGARVEAKERRDGAVREAQATAGERIDRILELRRQIAARAEEIAAVAEDPESVMARVAAFLQAMDKRAELIAAEAGMPPAEAEPEAEPDLELEPDPAAAAPQEAPPSDVNGTAAAAQAAPHPVLPGTEGQLLEEARLGALRMAVAGASRDELEPVLRQIFAVDDAVAVLDDVYGRPRSPFPKWASAAKRAG
jgi:hypothetical protein